MCISIQTRSGFGSGKLAPDMDVSCFVLWYCIFKFWRTVQFSRKTWIVPRDWIYTERLVLNNVFVRDYGSRNNFASKNHISTWMEKHTRNNRSEIFHLMRNVAPAGIRTARFSNTSTVHEAKQNVKKPHVRLRASVKQFCLCLHSVPCSRACFCAVFIRVYRTIRYCWEVYKLKCPVPFLQVLWIIGKKCPEVFGESANNPNLEKKINRWR